jgi:serine/threonine-protein kinase
VGAVALCPVVQLAGTAIAQRNLGLYAQGLAVATVWSASGAAIAVYGSYRINDLRRKAFEARRLGQYRLLRRLGAGGMGEVHLAEHVLLRRACAVKLIRPDRGGFDARARFEREVKATAALTHPNTVEVYDYGQAEDGTFYYVMEYLPGLTLQELVDRHGPLPFGRAVHLLRQVCSALREAHDRGLIHRDIKPGNVIACERGGLADVVKLLDFGLVRVFGGGADDGRLTREGTIAGTPAYLSPEQAKGGARVDARSGLYALGAVAYFLLAGRPPFVHANWVQTVHAHAYEAPPPLGEFRPDVPPDLAAVVVRCLEKDASARFPDAAALEAALAGCDCAGDWTAADAVAWWAGQSAGTGPDPTADPGSTLRTGRPGG